MRLLLFGCIRDHLIALRNSVQNGPNYCKRSCHKVVSDFFTTKAPDPPPCDPKLTFWCVRTIWLHSGQFGCLTKLDAKQAELVQKIVPRSGVGIFRNECTRSTPLDPKLMFWYILYNLGAFETFWLPYKTRCKTGQTSSKVRATKSRRIFSQRRHPIHPM